MVFQLISQAGFQPSIWLVDLSINLSIRPSIDRSIIDSVCQSITQSVGQAIIHSVGQSIIHSVGQSIIHFVNLSCINDLVGQSIDQSDFSRGDTTLHLAVSVSRSVCRSVSPSQFF